MVRLITFLSLTILLSAPAPAADPQWEVIALGGGKLAVTKGWRNLDGIQPRMVVFRQGDGVRLPPVDETGAPLQAGLTVEQFAGDKRSVAEVMAGLVAGVKKAPHLELVGREAVEDVTLSDGAGAKLLTAEFVKEGTRRSLQLKLVAKGGDGTAWVVSAFLVGGKGSVWPTPTGKYAGWLRAHVTSLALDPDKFDGDRVEAAYTAVAK